MPRGTSWGTPSRSERYLFPRPAYRLVLASLAIGGVVLLGFCVFQATGLRAPLSPGDVTSGHANYGTRCEACHAPGQGVSNWRCQRCHDAGGMGRLTQPAHVLFGSADPRKAAGSEVLACARCHVEHRGSDARLATVDEAQCRDCHSARKPAEIGLAHRISSLASHPEFKLLRDGLRADPRLLFSHKRHMREMVKEGAPGEWEACTVCHVPERERGRDLERIAYAPHCGRCHDDSELTMPPMPAQDVGEDVGPRGAGWAFSKVGGSIQKAGVRHADDWVLYNLRKLQWEVYPDAYARDRGALEARVSQLERRIAQAEPVVGVGLQALQEREAALLEEIRRLEERSRSPQGGGEVAAGLARVSEVVAALSAAGDAEAGRAAEEMQGRARVLEPSGSQGVPLAAEDFEARRRELLAVLDALAASDPSRKRTVDDLRRRALALVPGEPGRENVERALRQRRDDLARVRDEMSLRDAGVPSEVRTLPERLALQRELARVRGQLGWFYSFEGAAATLTPTDRARKEQTLRSLTGEGSGERCAKCHSIEKGSLLAPRPARSVLVRAAFAHKKHLVAPLPEPGLWQRLVALVPGRPANPPGPDVERRYRCAFCHNGIEKAGDAPRPPAVPGVASCRECHKAGGTRADCQLCHRYHPPGAVS